jgi:hypothetical protein
MRGFSSVVPHRRMTGAALATALLLPLALAVMLQAGAGKGINNVGVGLGRKPNPWKFSVHAVTDASGTFVFTNVPPGSYTIWGELPGTPNQQLPAYSSHDTTITFAASLPGAADAKAKNTAPPVEGANVVNNMLHVTGALIQGRVFSGDFTVTSGPATITGIIIGIGPRVEAKAAHSATKSSKEAPYVLTCPPEKVERIGKCVYGVPGNVVDAGSLASVAIWSDPGRTNTEENLAVNSGTDPDAPGANGPHSRAIPIPSSPPTTGNLKTAAVSTRAVSLKGISASRSYDNQVSAPTECPSLSITHKSRVNNSVVKASLTLTNNGPGAALSVKATDISCNNGFEYAAQNGLLTLPFAVHGAANLKQGESVGLDAFFKNAGASQTGSFTCTLKYVEGKSCRGAATFTVPSRLGAPTVAKHHLF